MNLVKIRFRFNVMVITNTNLKIILDGSGDEAHCGRIILVATMLDFYYTVRCKVFIIPGW